MKTLRGTAHPGIGGTLAVVLALSLPIAPAAAEPRSQVPERFTATFDVEAYGATVGETRWKLERESGTRLRFESQTRPVGLASLMLDGERREHSVFTLDESNRPRPLQYRFERSGARAQQAAIDFDWKALKATSRYRDRTVELPLAPGTLDALVYVLALMQDLAADRPDIRLQLAERGKIKTYVVTREGSERIETGLGALDTVRVARSGDDGRKTTVWAAPSLGYLPARIEHDDRGGTRLVLRLRETRAGGDERRPIP